MRLFGRIIRGLVLAFVMFITAIVFWLSFSPPALLLVAPAMRQRSSARMSFLPVGNRKRFSPSMYRRPATLCSSW